MHVCMMRLLISMTAILSITAVAGTATLRQTQGSIAANMNITIIANVAMVIAVVNRAMCAR